MAAAVSDPRFLSLLVSGATPSLARGYRDVDVTLAKAFGLPNMPVLGENAKFEFRVDAYNLFNNLNFKPDSIVNNIDATGFGRAQSALAARTVTLTARFSF